MTKLDGWKTYIVAALAIAALVWAGAAPADSWIAINIDTILAALGFGGIAALRHGVGGKGAAK